jgi:hypothetical protein
MPKLLKKTTLEPELLFFCSEALLIFKVIFVYHQHMET